MSPRRLQQHGDDEGSSSAAAAAAGTGGSGVGSVDQAAVLALPKGKKAKMKASAAAVAGRRSSAANQKSSAMNLLAPLGMGATSSEPDSADDSDDDDDDCSSGVGGAPSQRMVLGRGSPMSGGSSRRGLQESNISSRVARSGSSSLVMGGEGDADSSTAGVTAPIPLSSTIQSFADRNALAGRKAARAAAVGVMSFTLPLRGSPTVDVASTDDRAMGDGIDSLAGFKVRRKVQKSVTLPDIRQASRLSSK